MNKKEQAALIKAYCKGIEEYYTERADKVPEEWDGHELRWYILHIVLTQIAYMKLSPSRKKAFNNTIIVENL